MSIAAHLVVGFAFVVAGSWNVTFPDESPRMSLTYSLALPPTMPPPPPAAAAVPKQTVTPAPKQIVKREDIVAPTIIPDTIPLVLPPEEVKLADIAPVGDETSGASGGVEGGVGSGDGSGGGVTGGSPVGIAGGFLGGVDGGIPADTVIVQRHHQLPTSMTPMSMVYPFYPEEARVRGWEDAVTVRYVIGKDGRVKTVTVLEAPQREVFQTNVVKAIRHWRFRPLVKNGVKHEVIHELVIHFKLNQGVG